MMGPMGSLDSRFSPEACRQQLSFLFLLDHVVHGLRGESQQHRIPETSVLERAAPLRGL